jgi:AraC-like DNA-binding protein
MRFSDILARFSDARILLSKSSILASDEKARLLVGDQGARLRHLMAIDSQSRHVARAIDWLRANYMHAFRVDDLAKIAAMSVSTFHYHFKAITAMSPLQYQKQLRLQEARRLMLVEAVDAASAAHRVGYESASQFSREYNRFFGAPPRRDLAHAATSARAAAHVRSPLAANYLRTSGGR